MYHDDKQLGVPQTVYADTKVEIESDFSGPGMIAYAEGDFGYYNGSAWVWLGDHNSLDNLQGGASGEYYHLTSAEYTALVTGVDASSYHTHDVRYYTEAELQGDGAAAVHYNNLTNVPTTFNAAPHDVASATYHSVTGSQWDVVGLTATDTLGLLTPSFAPGANAALLRTNSDGWLDIDVLRVSGYVAPSSGAGLEFYYTGGNCEILAFDRGGAAYLPLRLCGEQVTFEHGSNVNIYSGFYGPQFPEKLIHYDDGDTYMSFPAANSWAVYVGGDKVAGVTAGATWDFSNVTGITVENSDFIGIGASDERIEFYAAGYIALLGANVGIGTTSPDGELEIYNTDFIQSIINRDNDLNNVGIGEFVFQAKGTALASVRGISEGTGEDSGALAFLTKETAGTNNTKMYIDPDGNVGIGTTSPAAKLDVAGAPYNTDYEQLRFSRLDNPSIRYHSIYTRHDVATANSYMQFKIHDANTTTSQATVMTLTGGGSVGIGETSPTISDGAGLHIGGKIIRVDESKSPTSSGTGNVGEICWDSDYIYVCVATNTWKRAALTGGY